jgi:hypothetical protein
VHILATLHAFAIPAAWSMSARSLVIVDTGASCGTDTNSCGYSTSDDIGKVWACDPPGMGL